ncbi:MAG: beta-glucosidase [Eubacterium sp.]|nr:beta-glucosidase [Eubacterium sp.]
MSFPKNFMWGAASASYQIEGGAREDGKGLSIWDAFSHQPGKTFNGHTGDVACDSYHRFEEDLDLMQSLGIRHYRFSISWPRVIPEGIGDVNQKGLAYYDKVVDGCLKRGIEPWITLYHWDLPLALYYKGGWLNRETAYAFEEYAKVIASHFKGRVRRFMTINEPQCIIGLGHGNGFHAPGTLLSEKEMFLSWHHVMLAHGLAVRVIRDIIPDSIIGLASTGALAYTEQKDIPTPKDLVEASFLSLPKEQNEGWYFNHQWFLDPVVLGYYPEDPENPWTAFKGEVDPADLAIICQPLDFIGLNIYNGSEMVPAQLEKDPSVPGKTAAKENESAKYVFAEKYPGYPRTALKWPITPGVLYWGPRLIYERYGLPIVIAENGQSCNDRIFLDGKVHDPDRIDFLARYLGQLKKACEDDIPVIAYLHWALTDNYEWHSGYDDRFGLIYIDYRDGTRIAKDSAFWYRDVIAENGESL